MQLADEALPAGLDPEVRQEAKAALVCDLLSGAVKQKQLDAKTVRRYVTKAYISDYGEVRLDYVLLSGTRRVDLMSG